MPRRGLTQRPTRKRKKVGANAVAVKVARAVETVAAKAVAIAAVKVAETVAERPAEIVVAKAVETAAAKAVAQVVRTEAINRLPPIGNQNRRQCSVRLSRRKRPHHRPFSSRCRHVASRRRRRPYSARFNRSKRPTPRLNPSGIELTTCVTAHAVSVAMNARIAGTTGETIGAIVATMPVIAEMTAVTTVAARRLPMFRSNHKPSPGAASGPSRIVSAHASARTRPCKISAAAATNAFARGVNASAKRHPSAASTN